MCVWLHAYEMLYTHNNGNHCRLIRALGHIIIYNCYTTIIRNPQNSISNYLGPHINSLRLCVSEASTDGSFGLSAQGCMEAFGLF